MVYISGSGQVQVEIYQLPPERGRDARSRCTPGLVGRRDLVDEAQGATKLPQCLDDNNYGLDPFLLSPGLVKYIWQVMLYQYFRKGQYCSHATVHRVLRDDSLTMDPV